MRKRTAIYIVVCFVLVIVVWASEASHFNDYLDLRALLRTAACLTALVWGLMLWLGRSWWYQPKLESWQQLQRAMVLGLLPLLVVPPLFSASNRWGTAALAVPTVVELEQEVPRYQSRFGNVESRGKDRRPTQYLLFFYYENQLYRIAYTEGPKFTNEKQGDPISLPISKGRWGFPWIPIDQL